MQSAFGKFPKDLGGDVRDREGNSGGAADRCADMMVVWLRMRSLSSVDRIAAPINQSSSRLYD